MKMSSFAREPGQPEYRIILPDSSVMYFHSRRKWLKMAAEIKRLHE
jgi:hypothetical protein